MKSLEQRSETNHPTARSHYIYICIHQKNSTHTQSSDYEHLCINIFVPPLLWSLVMRCPLLVYKMLYLCWSAFARLSLVRKYSPVGGFCTLSFSNKALGSLPVLPLPLKPTCKFPCFPPSNFGDAVGAKCNPKRFVTGLPPNQSSYG